MTSAMVALVGGQPLPNLIPVRYYKPDAVLFVFTNQTSKVYQQLKAVLDENTLVHSLETDAFDIPTIEHDLKQWIHDNNQQFPPESMVFNLTGGTKAMSLAAYRVAEEWRSQVIYLESEGKKSRIYRYRWDENDQFMLLEKPILPGCIELKDFLNIYLGKDNWKEVGAGGDEGSPFETALATLLHEKDYEVMVGVKTMNGQVDLDLVIRYENQVGIIEAKTGKKGGSLDGIRQLNNAIRQLGLYTQQFYVITVEPNETHEALVAASNIKVISCPGYGLCGETLTSDDSDRLLERIGAAFGVSSLPGTS